MRRLVVVLAILAVGAVGAFAQAPQAPREVSLPIEGTIALQVGETRIFQFGEAVDRVGLSEDNIVDVRSMDNHAFAFKGIAMGKVFVTARSEDSSEAHRIRIVVGGHQVKIYSRDEPDYLSVNCDEFGCGPSSSSKRQPNSATIRTPTGGGGFVERTYN